MPAWLLLVILISLTAALAYQIGTRRFGWRVVGYAAVILAAVLAAEAGAEAAGWSITRVGDLRLLPDLAAALVAVGVLWFLGI